MAGKRKKSKGKATRKATTSTQSAKAKPKARTQAQSKVRRGKQTTATTNEQPDFPSDAIWEGRLAEVKAYVRAGGDIDARPIGYENTLLIDAIRAGRKALFDWLLEVGADPNGIDFAGSSTLQHAAESGVVHFVQALLDRGANIHHVDPGGLNALHSAAQCDRTGAGPKALPVPQKSRVIELLLKAGADPSLQDNAKRSALDFIEGSPNQEGLEFLS